MEISDSLRALISEKDAPDSLRSSESPEHHVATFLMSCIGTDSSLSPALRDEGLDELSRKLSLRRSIRRSYDANWKFAVDKARLEANWWPVLLYLLISASSDSEGNSETGPADALKHLNAVFVGLDFAQELDIESSVLSEIENLAEHHLQVLTN